MKVSQPITVLAVTGALLASGSIALGAGTPPTGGAVKLFVTPVGQLKGKVTVTGAIGDYGTSISEDKNGKPDVNGVYTKVTLKQGGFIINTTGFNKAIDHAKAAQINHTNCSVSFTGSGPATISAGTGAYAGISGTISIKLTFAGIAPKKGSKCDLTHGPTSGLYQAITATGRVSFSQ